jgi:Ca2+-binding EF-hand superfamily protein
VQKIVSLVDEDDTGLIEFDEFLAIIKGGQSVSEFIDICRTE